MNFAQALIERGWIVLFALLIGFYFGLRFGKAPCDEMRADVESAQRALEAARDSLRTLPAGSVRIDTIVRPGQPIVRIVRERDTVVLVGPVDTVRTHVTDTLWQTQDGRIIWSFSEKTDAYNIEGECEANVIRPELSVARYRLDVHEAAICGREYRFGLTAGIVAGRPHFGPTIRLSKRWLATPLVAVESEEDELVRIRFGGQMTFWLR